MKQSNKIQALAVMYRGGAIPASISAFDAEELPPKFKGGWDYQQNTKAGKRKALKGSGGFAKPGKHGNY